MPFTLPDWFVVLLAIAVIVLGSARLTRVIWYDKFPPAAWLRAKWDDLTERPGTKRMQWNLLLHCPWCLSFWVALGCVGWFIGGWYVEWIMWAWWVFWGTLAASYVGTIILVRDEPEE